MAEKICCVTGHRDLSEDEMELLRPRLATEVEQAVAAGFNCFLSGFAEGADLLFAEIVARMKRDNPKLRLEAAIPYRGRYARLMEQPGTRALLYACDSVAVLREAFTPDAFMARNRYMVERSERVIAVYDGRARGGTAATVRMARELKRELRMIKPARYQA